MSLIVAHLTEACGSLVPENWRKGAYFKRENGTLCMCAHGAVQRAVNPQVKEFLESFEFHSALDLVEGARVLRAADESNEYRHYYYTEQEVWTHRPSWAIPEHYLLGMVGLTAGFNDSYNTTFAQIHEKFNAAIELAIRLEV